MALENSVFTEHCPEYRISSALLVVHKIQNLQVPCLSFILEDLYKTDLEPNSLLNCVNRGGRGG